MNLSELSIDTNAIDNLVNKIFLSESTSIGRDNLKHYLGNNLTFDQQILIKAKEPVREKAEKIIKNFNNHFIKEDGISYLSIGTILELSKSVQECGIYAIQKGLEKTKADSERRGTFNILGQIESEDILFNIREAQRAISKVARDCNLNGDVCEKCTFIGKKQSHPLCQNPFGIQLRKKELQLT